MARRSSLLLQSIPRDRARRMRRAPKVSLPVAATVVVLVALVTFALLIDYW